MKRDLIPFSRTVKITLSAKTKSLFMPFIVAYNSFPSKDQALNVASYMAGRNSKGRAITGYLSEHALTESCIKGRQGTSLPRWMRG